MKIGICTNMNATDDGGVGYGQISLAAQLGFEYIELPLVQISELDERTFQDVLAVVRQEGIPCEACNNLLPGRVKLTGDGVDHDIIREYAERAFSRAALLGARILVLGSADARRLPDGYENKRANAQMVEALHILVDMLPSKEMRIVLEPLCRLECNYLHTMDECLELARVADMPEVGCLADFYHFDIEHDSLHGIENAGELLWHVHIANPEGRVMPTEKEAARYAPFFQALKRIQYDSRISIEANSVDFEQDAQIGLRYLRSAV